MATKPSSGRRSDGKSQLTASQRFWREVRGYAEALVIAFLVVTFVFNTVGVVGSSMQPTLDGGSGELPVSLFTGDRVFIPKYDTWLRRMGVLPHYQRGEIVVVREPANAPSAQMRSRRPFFIKRLIAVPGDHLKITDGQVSLNGFELDQSYITGSGEIDVEPVNFPVITQQNGEVTGMSVCFFETIEGTWYPQLPTDRRPCPVYPAGDPRVQLFYGSTLEFLAPIPEGAPSGEPFIHELVIPEDHYFIMGDNRSANGSEDSRYFGPVRAITVAGRATAVIWPPRRDGEWSWRRLTPPETFGNVPAAEGEPHAGHALPDGGPSDGARTGRVPATSAAPG